MERAQAPFYQLWKLDEENNTRVGAIARQPHAKASEELTWAWFTPKIMKTYAGATPIMMKQQPFRLKEIVKWVNKTTGHAKNMNT
jgi:hypothetical protein